MQNFRRNALRSTLAVAVTATSWAVIDVGATAVADPGDGILDDVPTTTPSSLGDLDLTDLQYGDPTEGLDLVEPPEADATGGASVAHPLAVPSGRAGVQPELAVTYDSGGGTSWVGTGWDLSVGAVSVDTAFGAPRYLPTLESETYLLDGERLFPNAIRTDLEARVPNRSDWVLQQEDDHDLIVRHGTGPSAYCWEAIDTDGNHRWYGGEPDGNGGCARDESAILSTPDNGAPDGGAGDFHWALTYVEDISGNVMRYHYDELTNQSLGRAQEAGIGVSLYLSSIEYTGFVGDGAPDRPAYRVDFLRDTDVVGSTPRLDMTVDASAGSPVVTRELLRRVEVQYLSPAFYESGAAAQLVKGWTFEYETGPFDKTLLTGIGQFGSGGAGTEHAWHEFTWFDDVTAADGTYAGFSAPVQYGGGDDNPQTPVNIAAESALSTSWRAGADGGAYIGFNPIIPNKIGSFGGSFNISGGQTNEVSTLVDLDGDSLPDKVWASGGTIMYRKNLRAPGTTAADMYTDPSGRTSWFGQTETVTGIDGLGRSSDLRIDLHFEAYPLVAIQVGGGFGFSFGDEYFEDVNGDGRVDFIQSGSAGGHTVWFNVLNASGIPTFIDSDMSSTLADRLEVPLDDFVSGLATASIDEVSDILINTSPRIDTVRRWLAPYTGKIRVTGTAAFTAGTYNGDGAQVSIEHAGQQRWVHELDKDDVSEGHDVTFDVVAGQPVWFRLHVIDNASNDQVSWAPVVTYVDGNGAEISVSPDASGRSQSRFSSADDFTLFGRSGARTSLSEPETIQVNVTVTTYTGLSDALDVILFHGHGGGDPVAYELMTIPQLTTTDPAGTGASQEITVAAPTTNVGEDGEADTDDDFEENDWIEVEVRSDSPVDPTEFSIEVTTTAPGIDPPDLSDIDPAAKDEVEIPLDIPIVPNVRVFSRTDNTTAYTPITSPNRDQKQAKIEVELEGDEIDDGNAEVNSPAVITVKTLDGGVVASKKFTVEHADGKLKGSDALEFQPTKNTTYYLEVSVADPAVGEAVDIKKFDVTWKWDEEEEQEDGSTKTVEKSQTDSDVGQLHWPDVDGMFPSGNRGWAYAGYNADHADADDGGPINEDLFVFDAEAEGYDKDTDIPDAPSAGDVKSGATDDPGNTFASAFPFIPWGGNGSDMADRWRAAEKETMNGTAGGMQSDRLGADTPLPGGATTGREAPQALGLSGDFNFMLGLVASFTAAAGGGRELRGFEDFNGDGFPDIRSGDNVEYTGPRGANIGENSNSANPYDTSLAVGGGLGGSAISISSTGKPSANSDGGGAGSKVEPTSSKPSRGMNIGLGFDVSAQWTNPLADSDAYSEISGGGSDAPDIQGDLASDRGDTAGFKGTPLDSAYIDVNGDGLPDRVTTYTEDGQMWVNLNLGYRFADDAIQWSTGRTSADKDISGSLSVGFELNAYEFAGGVAYSEGVNYSLFDWADVDGDGVPDRMNNVGDGQPRTVFGSADGMDRTEVAYGTFPNGEVRVDAAYDGVDLPTGQMNVSRSTGLSGGVDFSFYIGPICIVACYIVINPGIHGGYDRQTSQIQMMDMNGDGYLDVVKSTDYEDVQVWENQRGRTNLLESVTNPLGGQFRVDYERVGNTITNPESMWVMTSVDVDDGRSGDGPDVQASTYEYSGAVFDPLLREQLGFDRVVERQLDAPGGTTLVRYERDYLNGNPMEAGTLVQERMYAGDSSTLIQQETFSWVFVNADPHGGTNGPHGGVVASLPDVGTPGRILLFDTALSPRLMTDTLEMFDGDGDVQMLRTAYTYDVIGNVLTVHDENEHEIDGDDTFTVITYSDCANRSGDRILGPDGSWVSVPATVTVYGNDEASGEILAYRNGGDALCDNAAPIRIAELVGNDPVCGPLYAITELSFDTHGSFNGVAYPSNEVPGCAAYPPDFEPYDENTSFDGCDTLSASDDASRYCVDYVYDDHRFTDIATVTDNHGVSSSATYDPLTGRLASRTDENGNVTSYGYDAAGRVHTITAPKEQGSGSPTVRYEYGGLSAVLDHAGQHTWSTVHHTDAFNAGTTIDTATFVDGIGRTVQRKRDAEVDGVAGEARIVEGAVEYDALGREVKEWYPVVETVAARGLTAYNTWSSETDSATTHVPVTKPIVREFDLIGRMTKQTLPDDSVETFAYDFDVLPNSAALYGNAIVMSRITSTDVLGKANTRWLDVGAAQFRREDAAAPASDPDGGVSPLAALPGDGTIGDPRIVDSTGTPVLNDLVTTYDYDRLGRLVSVTDTVGAVTTHTYDLQSNVTSTTTPDGGTVARTFAPNGAMLTTSRSTGTVASYQYDRERLVGTTYTDGTPTVTYTYGAPGATDNGAGRVVGIVDGSMDRTYGYDADGNVSRETATRDAMPFGSLDLDPPTYETLWSYDSIGRLDEITYPTGEVLGHEYDLGGRPDRLVSQAPQHDLYDQYGATVPRPDVEIVYVDETRYDQFGEPTYQRTGTGVETNYTYEPTRRFLAAIDTASTSVTQYDGTLSVAQPLQHLSYTYDAVGNVRDVLNGLYREPGDTTIAQLGPPPVNNVPGPAQQAYTYDGHYRLTGGVGTYVDRQEVRDYTYEASYAPNGNLLSKKQVTTTTSTTSKGGGKKGNVNSKKGTGTGTTGGTTGEPTCESNTGSGGGSFNQDPETTYVIAEGNLVYDVDAAGNPIHRLLSVGTRDYSYDDNGNMTGWEQPCANGTSDISRTFTYDAENRTVRIAEGNNDTEYRYSAEGERALERGPGGLTWFVNEHFRSFNDGLLYSNVFMGERLIASHRTDPQPPPPAPCTDTDEFTCPCPSGSACRVDDVAECDLLSKIYDPTTSTCQPKESRKIYFVHADLQGSLRVATNETGGVFQYMEYLPTGRPWVAGQSTIKDTPYLFAGGWTDATYKLVNFGQRWYDPREQNFLSPEPLLVDDPYAAVEDPSLLAAYTYATSNPLRYVDPDGRASKVASTGFKLGKDNKKHEQGDVTLSAERRAKREQPAITFGGRYTNDGTTQARVQSWIDAKDNVDRFTTIFAITTEDGVRKIRVFGGTVSRKNVDSADAAPDPGPGNSGAAPDNAAPTAPPDPGKNPGAPDASAPGQDSANSGGNAAGAGGAAAGNDTGPAAPPPDAGNAGGAGADDPSPPPAANAAPAAASGAAPGPDQP